MQIITLDSRPTAPSSEIPNSFMGSNGTTDTNRPTPQVHKCSAEESNPSGLISERAADAPRPLKAIYIGAGISGIIAAIKFRDAVPDLDLTIYEKNPDLGGTWYENRYPGCACGK